MSVESWEEVLKLLEPVASSANSVASSTAQQQLAELTAELQGVTQTPNTQSSPVSSALHSEITAMAGGRASQSAGESVGGSLLSFVGAGLGISPLLKGLFSLFGGGDDEAATPPTLPIYDPPAAVSFEGLYQASTGSVAEGARGQGGEMRAMPSRATNTAPQITVNVQAMDSRSFLDHSDDIARAVRLAMLQSNVLNDVVKEL